MNSFNFETSSSDNKININENEKILLRKYSSTLLSDIENIENFDVNELKKFCLKCEKYNDFLWSEQTLEKRIIRENIIKQLSSKDKYFHLKMLWWFIIDKELESEIVKLLKENVPNNNEAFILNWILNKWDEFWFSDKVDAILLINESDEEEREQIDSQDELDMDEDVKIEKNKRDNKIIELDDLDIVD